MMVGAICALACGRVTIIDGGFDTHSDAVVEAGIDAVTDGDGSLDAMPPPPIPTRGGSITLGTGTWSGSMQTTANVAFWEIPPAPNDPCVTSTEGQCRVTTCWGDIVSDGGTVDPGYKRSAGQISIYDTTNPDAGAIDLAGPSAYGYSAPSGLGWVAGDMLTVRAAGDVVPAFMATIDVPAQLHVMNPALDDAGTFSAYRATGIVFDWTPGPGTLLVTIGDHGSDALIGTRVRCLFPGAIYALAVSTGVVNPGGYEITIRAINGSYVGHAALH
jgi:hypothetical protein